MTSYAEAWGLPRVLDFFAEHRATTSEVYPSEWFFLKDLLAEGISVLDIGCAQGGFAGVLSEHLRSFTYTGIDINPAMVEAAKAKHPGHRFLCLPEGDTGALGDETFDLVLVLGILHLHENWRATLASGWRHAKGAMLFDLRETDGPSLEDKRVSFFAMDFNGGGAQHEAAHLPYVVLNAGVALSEARRLTPGAAKLARYGYLHPPSGAARTPLDLVMTNVYCARR
jgi:SAM-dependent methyltransferase